MFRRGNRRVRGTEAFRYLHPRRRYSRQDRIRHATGVGRRIRDKVSLSQLSLRFKCHYEFSISFCNPDSGHEKGNVENKIGYSRRNFFVSLPSWTVLNPGTSTSLQRRKPTIEEAVAWINSAFRADMDARLGRPWPHLRKRLLAAGSMGTAWERSLPMSPSPACTAFLPKAQIFALTIVLLWVCRKPCNEETPCRSYSFVR